MKKYIKKFQKWFFIKPNLNDKSTVPMFKEREVWMCHLGVNVGYELDGKNNEFLRPVLIFRKLSRESAIVVPLVGKRKRGSWYVNSYVNKKKGSYCLHQIRMLDCRRLKYKLVQVSPQQYDAVRDALCKLLKG